MKKIIIFLLIIVLFCPYSYSFGRKKKNLEGKGYSGNLPNIQAEFSEEKHKTKETQSPIILNENSFNINPEQMREAPLNNTQYVDVIIKKGSVSDYVNDINELIPILKKLRACIEQKKDLQKFNAIVSNYIDNVAYITNKYKNKPEAYYDSYEKILEMASYAKKVAITRTEAKTYNKYLGYYEIDGVYSPENINNLLENTLFKIETTLDVIKEVK